MGESTGMFIVGVNEGSRLEFTIDPFRNEGLQFRGVVSSSAISPLSKLDKDLAMTQTIDIIKQTIFNMCEYSSYSISEPFL
jgi:hypothetical protein